MRPAARGARAKRDTDNWPASHHGGGRGRGTFVSARAVNVLTVKRPHLVQLFGPRVSILARTVMTWRRGQWILGFHREHVTLLQSVPLLGQECIKWMGVRREHADLMKEVRGYPIEKA